MSARARRPPRRRNPARRQRRRSGRLPEKFHGNRGRARVRTSRCKRANTRRRARTRDPRLADAGSRARRAVHRQSPRVAREQQVGLGADDGERRFSGDLRPPPKRRRRPPPRRRHRPRRSSPRRSSRLRLVSSRASSGRRRRGRVTFVSRSERPNVRAHDERLLHAEARALKRPSARRTGFEKHRSRRQSTRRRREREYGTGSASTAETPPTPRTAPRILARRATTSPSP